MPSETDSSVMRLRTTYNRGCLKKIQYFKHAFLCHAAQSCTYTQIQACVHAYCTQTGTTWLRGTGRVNITPQAQRHHWRPRERTHQA